MLGLQTPHIYQMKTSRLEGSTKLQSHKGRMKITYSVQGMVMTSLSSVPMITCLSKKCVAWRLRLYNRTKAGKAVFETTSMPWRGR